MTDREKVIKGFECCHVMVHDLGPDKTSCGICPYKNVQTEEQINLGGIECIAVLHDDALAMLKEQEAKPVKITKNAYNHKFYYCPNCGRGFEDTYYKRPLYCDKCGQAVKWE